MNFAMATHNTAETRDKGERETTDHGQGCSRSGAFFIFIYLIL